MPLALRDDFDAARLKRCARGSGNADQVRRLLALAAIYDGKSVDTTMGFTPLEGLMMGTRSGSVDPGLLLYLLRQDHLTPDALDQILNTQSGLKGISGISGDLRELTVALAQGNERARLALEIYVHRLRSGIGSLLASLGGIDVLIFTGGVGEHSALVRAETCKAFRFLGLSLDTLKNESVLPDQDIADAESTVRVLVITAQEDAAIARECWHLLQFSA